MKKYPRIYSLSTIGLRQHQEFDYKFHPFRTDFVGDSGCGKSMIADLLQLMFVGSEFFVSPSPSTKPRLPTGMVLPINNNFGAGIGFAVLNVEIAPSSYLGVGICIEQGNNSTSHFIIQQGYDEDAPLPFSKVLTVADLIKDDKLPNREDFIANVTEQGLVYKPLQRRKYHQWLYAQHILPVDLSESERILKDYAHIIQSFSRGHSLLKISESDSLKEFLFGTEKAKEMLAKYHKAVDELQNTTIQYGRNK
ncbi:MAG: DNA repair protein Rad50, partial [Sphingobacteriales bacterium]